MEKEAEDKRLVDEANKVAKKRLLNREEGVSPVLIYVYIFISLVFRLMVSIPYFTEYKV